MSEDRAEYGGTPRLAGESATWPAERLAALLRRMPRFKAILYIDGPVADCALCSADYLHACAPDCELQAFWREMGTVAISNPVLEKVWDNPEDAAIWDGPPYIEPDDSCYAV